MDLKQDKYNSFISSNISINKKGQEVEMNLKLEKNAKKINLLSSISGTVIDSLNKPIKNAIVNLMDENFNSLNYVTTNENGKYLITEILYKDTYNLIVMATGKLINRWRNCLV